MTDVRGHLAHLRDRIERKRTELLHYLDRTFYTSSHEVLAAVRKLDEKGFFEQDPSSLPGYRLRVAKPIHWEAIEANLQKYKYRTPAAFMADMRLVLENCYAYNGVKSPLSAIGRDIEIAMEALFVKELGAAPPKKSEILELGHKLSKQTSLEVWNLWCLYERKDAHHTGTKAQLSLHTLSLATQRRILQLLHRAAETKETARRPHSIPVKRPSPKPIPEPPSRSLLQTDDKVDFHEESAMDTSKEPALERVPQNARSGFAVRELSPVRMDCSDSGSDSEALDSFLEST